MDTIPTTTAAAPVSDPVSSSSASLSPSPSPSHSPNPNPNANGSGSVNSSSPSHDDLQGDESAPTPAAASAAPAARSSRRVPPPCWSVEEVIALIDSYQEKWYDLRRGNLRASHWQEVADAVNRRCLHHLPSTGPSSTRKTALQCRHKMEKLRKRYRAELQKSVRVDPRSPPTSSWEFFRKMDAMERGGANGPPAAAAASAAAPGHRSSRPGGGAPAALSPPSSGEESSAASDDDEDEEEELVARSSAMPGSYPYMGNGGGGSYHSGGHPFADMRSRFSKPSSRPQFPSRPHPPHHPDGKPGRYRTAPLDMFARESGLLRDYPEKASRQPPPGLTEVRKRVEKKRKEAGKGMGVVAAALRMLGEGLVRMERMKMDMDMEIHRARMETELRLTESMLEAQREIVETLFGGGGGGSGGGGYKKTRISPQ